MHENRERNFPQTEIEKDGIVYKLNSSSRLVSVLGSEYIHNKQVGNLYTEQRYYPNHQIGSRRDVVTNKKIERQISVKVLPFDEYKLNRSVDSPSGYIALAARKKDKTKTTPYMPDLIVGSDWQFEEVRFEVNDYLYPVTVYFDGHGNLINISIPLIKPLPEITQKESSVMDTLNLSEVGAELMQLYSLGGADLAFGAHERADADINERLEETVNTYVLNYKDVVYHYLNSSFGNKKIITKEFSAAILKSMLYDLTVDANYIDQNGNFIIRDGNDILLEIVYYLKVYLRDYYLKINEAGELMLDLTYDKEFGDFSYRVMNESRRFPSTVYESGDLTFDKGYDLMNEAGFTVHADYVDKMRCTDYTITLMVLGKQIVLKVPHKVNMLDIVQKIESQDPRKWEQAVRVVKTNSTTPQI